MAYIGSPAAPTVATVSDGTVTSAKLADDAVTSAKLVNNAVTSAKITDGAVTPSDLSTGHPSWDSSGVTSCFSGGSGTTGQLNLGYDLSAYWRIGRLDPAGTGSGNFQFKPDNGTSVLDITSSGKVSLGNTSSDGWLQIKNNNQSDVLITTNDTSGSGGAAMRFKVNNTTVGSISTNTTTTFYNTSSDYRLKENVVEVTDGINRVKLLKPSRFNFIVAPDKTVDGFLAHEVADVVPEAIHGVKDAMRTENVYDEDGNVTGTQQVPDYQGIDQSKLVPLLTAALQEAITKIESLEARVATLESA